MSTDSIDKHRLWVTKDENSAILFRDYQYLKLFLNVGVRNSLYETYKHQIDLDIPRSFPHSKWLKHPASIDLIKRQLQIWCVYSPIGYFQGMLFILIPLCYRYQNLDHLSFFAFGKIVESKTDIFFIPPASISPINFSIGVNLVSPELDLNE